MEHPLPKPLFVTLFMARSGSKFLRSLLNQHPDIEDFGEFFHDRAKKFLTEKDLFIGLGQVLLTSCPQRGIQFRYPRHFTEIPEFAELLISRTQAVRIIHLKRRNKLKGAISQQNAEALKKMTGKAHLFRKSEVSKLDKTEIDVPRALKEAQERDRLDAEYFRWAASQFETLEVFYEDLVEDRVQTVSTICRFLGLNPIKPDTLRESELVKVTSSDLSKAIANYDDLAREAKVLGLQRWLLDDAELAAQAGSAEPFDAGKASKNSHDTARASIRDGWDKALEFCGETRAGHKVRLVAEKLALRTNTVFLEDVVHNGQPRRIITLQGETIWQSSDAGMSWSQHDIAAPARKCFTTRTGRHFLQDKTGKIGLYDEHWAHIGDIETGPYPWHGTWSIDECPSTGTILWAEYPYCAETVNVWRSVDDGQSWSICFSVKGHGSDPKLGDIRHFHLVQKCTTWPGRWYLSSGDHLSQCRFWTSDDDGVTWQEIPLQSVNGPGANDLPAELYPLVYRFTGMIQLDDRLIWATDDTFRGNGARVCTMDKNALGHVRLFGGDCGTNEIRNLIQIDNRYALAISEAKLDIDAAYASVIEMVDEQVETTLYLPNRRGTKSNFMNGVSSKQADDRGRFFAQSDNIVLYPAPMTTRWKFDLAR